VGWLSALPQGVVCMLSRLASNVAISSPRTSPQMTPDSTRILAVFMDCSEAPMHSVDGPDRAFSRILLVSYGARADERSPLRLDLLFGRDNTLRSFSRPWPSTWPSDTAFSSLARIMRGLASDTKQQGNATCEDAKKIIEPDPIPPRTISSARGHRKMQQRRQPAGSPWAQPAGARDPDPARRRLQAGRAVPTSHSGSAWPAYLNLRRG
jgi:hypothetical protein